MQALCLQSACQRSKMVLQVKTIGWCENGMNVTDQPAALPLRSLLGLIEAALEHDVVRRLKEAREALRLRRRAFIRASPAIALRPAQRPNVNAVSVAMQP